MKNFNINNEVGELSKTFNFIEKKFERYYFLLDNLPDENESYIFVRNLVYFDSILRKIKSNFREIQVIKRLIKRKNLSKEMKSKMKKKAKDKAKSATYLLKYLVYLLNKYSIDKSDFEVQSILENQKEDFVRIVPKHNYHLVIDDYNEINDNHEYALIEGWSWDDAVAELKKAKDWAAKKAKDAARAAKAAADAAARAAKRAAEAAARAAKEAADYAAKQVRDLAKKIADPIIKAGKAAIDQLEKTAKSAADWAKKQADKALSFAKDAIDKIKDMFSNIWNNLKSILKLVGDIGEFIGKTLVKFIKLLWELAKWQYWMITVGLPKFLERFFSFWSLFSVKVKKTALLTIIIFFVLNIVITKYWDLLLGDITIGGKPLPSVPSKMIEYPALFFTSYIFWMKTRFLHENQQTLINFVSNKGSTLVGFLMTEVFNLPDDLAFRDKEMSGKKRVSLMLQYFSKHLISILYKTLILIFVAKKLLKTAITDIFGDAMINLKDILLFPLIIFIFITKFIINFIFSMFVKMIR